MTDYVDLDTAMEADKPSLRFFEPSTGNGTRAVGLDRPELRIKATPYFHRNPREIPTRQWLLAKHYVRRFVSMTVAPGGTGKTALALVEAISMVSGRSLLGGPEPKPLRVWYWNGEDPLDELERRIAAICIYHRISGEEDLIDRLFVDSGRTTPLIIASKLRDQVVVATPFIDDLIREIREKKIDVLIIDPFVSSHDVPENDNGAIDRVAKTWGQIADATGSAIELVHHVRKPAGASQTLTVDDARGASALIGAVRSARVLNVMSENEAEKAGISIDERRLYFRVDDGKANMRPPINRAQWYKLVSVPLNNGADDEEGDWIGVVEAWEMPGALDGVSREDVRKVQAVIGEREWAEHALSKDWAGHAVARALGIDVDAPGARQRVKMLLRAWIEGGVLKIERRRDSTKGREKPFVVVGAAA